MSVNRNVTVPVGSSGTSGVPLSFGRDSSRGTSALFPRVRHGLLECNGPPLLPRRGGGRLSDRAPGSLSWVGEVDQGRRGPAAGRHLYWRRGAGPPPGPGMG